MSTGTRIESLSRIVLAALLLTACGDGVRQDSPILDVRPERLQVGDTLIIEGQPVKKTNRRSLTPSLPTFRAAAKTTVTLEGTFTYPNRSTVLLFDGDWWQWAALPRGAADGLQAVWGSDSSNVFVVGTGGKALHFDGERWEELDTGTDADLYAVWGTSGSDVYAAGAGGAMVHYDGRRWQRMETGTEAQLRAIWGSGPSAVFAAGYRGTVLQLDGGAWRRLPTPTNRDLLALWGAAPNAVYAAGRYGTLLAFDGQRWAAVASGIKSDLHALWGRSATEVYAAGEQGMLLRFDGRQWSRQRVGTEHDLLALWGDAQTIFAAGEEGVLLQGEQDRWRELSPFTSQPVTGLWGTGSKQVVAVISRLEGVVRDQRTIELPASAVPAAADREWAERVLVPMTEGIRRQIGYARFEGRVAVTQQIEGQTRTVYAGSKSAPIRIELFPPSMRSLAQLAVAWASDDRVLSWLGIDVRATEGGLLVTSTTAGGSASLGAAAGIQVGDSLTFAGGRPLRSVGDLTLAVRKAQRGGALALAAKRGGRDLTLRVPAVRKPTIVPTSVVYLLVMLVFAVMALGLAMVLAGVLTWLERRLAARIQSRVGPNRVGPQGVLQWIADGIKLVLKEDVIPDAADRPLFKLAPYLVFTGLLGTFVVLPFGQYLIISDLNIGLLYLVAITGFVALGLMMAGWSSNNKWALLGGMRSAAQIISYEIPAGLALMVPVVLAGSLSTQTLVERQGGWPWEWFIFDNPFTFACFFIYFISALAEGNRTPFDLPEAESELVAGYQVEYSGWRFAVFMLSEWANIFVIGAVVTTVFLGGWQIPTVSIHEHAGWWGFQLLGLLFFMAKALTLTSVIIWIRWTLPRLRVDQMMRLCWKYFVPWAFASIIIVALWSMVAPDWLRKTSQVLTFVALGGGLALLFISRVIHNWKMDPEELSWKQLY